MYICNQINVKYYIHKIATYTVAQLICTIQALKKISNYCLIFNYQKAELKTTVGLQLIFLAIEC